MSYTANFPEPHGILSIHASAVTVNGRVWIFLGPSKTGKSTICRLLKTHAKPLADDGVYLVPGGDSTWGVARADHRPFHRPLSDEECIGLEPRMLYAVVRLYKAPYSCLTQIDRLRTCRYLTDAFFEIPRQREYSCESKQLAFSRLAVVACSVAGYELRFDRSDRAAEVFAQQFCLEPLYPGIDE